MWYLSLLLAGGLMLMLMIGQIAADEVPQRWVVYYNDKAPISAFAPYSLVVLDSDTHPPLSGLLGAGRFVLGYIGLGEVNKGRYFFKSVQNDGILLGENPNWPGSYFVDVRDMRWTKRVIEEIIPAILTQHFDGLFLDTLDNAEYLEMQDPVKYAGMVEASALLVKSIRHHYPQIQIMQNRGFKIATEVAPAINMLLGESIYTDYNFKSKTYKRVAESNYQEAVKLMRQAKGANPQLTLYTLDYSPPDQVDTLRTIYRVQREAGFIPYVATIDLYSIIPEP